MSHPRLMLFRFCLYGFLKNQQYYDPFLILIFLEKGLSFAAIGILFSFRAVCVNLMEIPAGAVADVVGRRRSMIVSFAAYIGSFAVFGLGGRFWTLLAAMFFFAVGEAFRTGTHKAMIFDWLERQGRLAERTAVYGRTRSWSKLGSATSVVVAAAVVFATDRYSPVFLVCIIPYLAAIVNFLGYPSYLDGTRQAKSPHGVLKTLFSALSQSFRSRPLRRMLIESMGYEGLFQSSKYYIQPVLGAACVSLPIMLVLPERRRMAISIGVVYFVLHLLGSFASRGAGRFAKASGGEERSARLLWWMNLAVFALMAVGILTSLAALVIVAFVLLAVFQNFWRPILIGRIASHADSTQTATVLSIESQAKSLFVAVVAPVLGWSIDLIAAGGRELDFLPVAALGMTISTLILIAGRQHSKLTAQSS